MYLNKKDMMQVKVVVPSCGHHEYSGEVYWINAQTMCRKCMYDFWEDTTTWRRGPNDYEYPLGPDGVDYIHDREVSDENDLSVNVKE